MNLFHLCHQFNPDINISLRQMYLPMKYKNIYIHIYKQNGRLPVSQCDFQITEQIFSKNLKD